MIRLRKNSKASIGLNIQPVFQIIVHKRDSFLLEAIRSQLGGIGSIGKIGDNLSRYIVTALKEAGFAEL